MTEYSHGVLFGQDFAILYASPGAQKSGLVDKLREFLRQNGVEKRLSSLTLNGMPNVVLTLPIANTTLVLVHPEDRGSTLLDFILTVDIAFDILNHFLTNAYEGVTVVDADAILRYISPVHERFFGFNRGDAIGRPVRDVIENTRLHEVIKTGHAEIGQIQEMRNVTRVVNRLPIHKNGKVIGAIGRVMFKGPEQVHDLSRQISSLRAEVNYYKKELAGLRQKTLGLEAVVGESDAIRRLKSEIRKVAPLDVSVFISGESGTGKELVAHALHNLSARGERPMVLLNCGALPDTLVESELFGYEGGAFTGAKREGRIGKFEMADHSSLFLDEIGDMPMETQVKLLRVIESGYFERLGSNKQRKADFRLISATNRNLRQAAADSSFRADLYFRINGVTLEIPPLRHRLEDIPLLVPHFMETIAKRIASNVRRIDGKALEMLQSFAWPGNVRQLYHDVQRAMIFAEGPELTVADFGHVEQGNLGNLRPSTAGASTIRETMGSFELTLIREALERHGGNKKRVAEALGISRSYLYKKLAEIEAGSDA